MTWWNLKNDERDWTNRERWENPSPCERVRRRLRVKWAVFKHCLWHKRRTWFGLCRRSAVHTEEERQRNIAFLDEVLHADAIDTWQKCWVEHEEDHDEEGGYEDCDEKSSELSDEREEIVRQSEELYKEVWEGHTEIVFVTMRRSLGEDPEDKGYWAHLRGWFRRRGQRS